MAINETPSSACLVLLQQRLLNAKYLARRWGGLAGGEALCVHTLQVDLPRLHSRNRGRVTTGGRTARNEAKGREAAMH